MDARIRRTIERMEEEVNRPLRVSDLAAAAGLSVAQLNRLFRRATGRTAGAHLNHVRMQRARILVERTSLPIASVMGLVGIRDRSHFTRGFRRAHGVCPRTLRVELRRHLRQPMTCDEIRPMASSLHAPHAERSTESTDNNEKHLKGKD